MNPKETIKALSGKLKSLITHFTDKKRYLLWGTSALLALGLLLLVMFSGMVPWKYIILILFFIPIFFFELFILQKRWGKVRFAIAAIWEVLIIVVCLYGGSVLYHATHMVNEITKVESDSQTELCLVSVYVLLDTKGQTLEELAQLKWGRVNRNASDAIDQVWHKVSERATVAIRLTVYDDMFSAADALRAGEIEVLLLDENFAGLIPEIEGYEWFETETRLVESLTEEVKVKNDDASQETSKTEGNDEEDNGQENATDGDGSSQNSSDVKNPDSSKEQESVQEPMELMEPPEYVDWNTLVNQDMITVADGTFVLYISGVDTWSSPRAKSRSDVNILAVVNTKTKDVLLVSTPRDAYLPMPTSNGIKDKLTHAGIYGIDNSIGTLEALYGVDSNYYARINFTGCVGIIDALGGIDVYSDATFTVGEDFSYVEGMNHMSGIEALAFARERMSFASGDLARGNHQMEVIKAVLNKCTSASILYNYANVMNSVSGCFSTDMPQQTIASLVKMQLNDMAQWNISSMSLSGSFADKTTYTLPEKMANVMLPSESSIQNIKNEIAKVLAGE